MYRWFPAAAAIAWCAACHHAQPAPASGGDPEQGRRTIYAAGCGACHTIEGVPGAHALVGPPLTGVAHRSIIAGRLPNTPENMERWILDPSAIDPRVAMPPLVGVPPQAARDIVAYLYSLQ